MWSPYVITRFGIHESLFKAFISLGCIIVFLASFFYQYHSCETIIRPVGDPSCEGTEILRNIIVEGVYTTPLPIYANISLQLQPRKRIITHLDIEKLVYEELSYTFVKDLNKTKIFIYLEKSSVFNIIDQMNYICIDILAPYTTLMQDRITFNNTRIMIQNIFKYTITGNYGTGLCIGTICNNVNTVIITSFINAQNSMYLFSVIFILLMFKYYKMYHCVDLAQLLLDHDKIDIKVEQKLYI